MSIARLVRLWEYGVGVTTISGGMFGAYKGVTVQNNSLVGTGIGMVAGGVAGEFCGGLAGSAGLTIITILDVN